MGKAGKQAYSRNQEWSDSSWSASPSWSVWPGAWPKKGSGQPDAKGKGKGKSKFPTYDGDWDVSVDPIEVIEERRFATAAQPSMAAVMQQTANVLRKAEGKVARIRKELAKKEAKWRSYQAALKASYVQEKQRSAGDQQRLQTELATALEEQEEAYQLAQRTSQGCSTSAMQVEDNTWEELGELTQPQTVRQDLQSLHLELQELMKRQEAVLGAGPKAAAVPPGLGSQEPAPVVGVQNVLPAPAYTDISPVRTVDNSLGVAGAAPHVAAEEIQTKPPTSYGPAPPTTDRRSSPLHPGQKLKQRAPGTGEPPRIPIKATQLAPPGTAPHGSLGDKLDVRRAMRPFSLPERPNSLPSQGAPEGDGQREIQQAAAAALLNDDISVDEFQLHLPISWFWAFGLRLVGAKENKDASLLGVGLLQTDAADRQEQGSVADRHFVQAYCLALSPHYHSELLLMPVGIPTNVRDFCESMRRALRTLRLRFAPRVVPTFPQLGLDYASVLVLPTWLSAVGKQAIVYDMRDIGGPVFAEYEWDRVTFEDCRLAAARHGLREWTVYVQGHTQPLNPGESFLAVEGGVVQFRPLGSGSFWRNHLHARLDLRNAWSNDPDIPEDDTEWPLYVTHGLDRTLYSTQRFPEEPAAVCIASFVDRAPDSVLMITPPGRVLANLDYKGTPCRDVLAVFPLTPCPDRQGILVFLDPRQTDHLLMHIYLPEPAVEPGVLIRYLHLSAPVGHKVTYWPRPDDTGRLVLSEGDVVTFGFVPDSWDSSEEDSSDESDSPSGDRPQHQDNVTADDGPTAGATSSFTGVQGRRSPRVASRSRSPRGTRHAQDAHEHVASCLPLPATPPKGSRHMWEHHFSQGSIAHGHDILTSVGESVLIPSSFLSETVCEQERVLHETGTAGFPAVHHIVKVSCPWLHPCPVSHKLLLEPSSSRSPGVPSIPELRFMTIELGHAWPFVPALGLGAPGVLRDFEEEAMPQAVQGVQVLVLKPLYKPESFVVQLQLPCTVTEAFAVIQDHRTPEAVRDFPHLLAATPQPMQGVCVLTANPQWLGLALTVCADLLDVDGRIFSVTMPDYVGRWTVLSLVDLPPQASLDVFIGLDEEPLPNGVQAHLFPGITVRIARPEQSFRDLRTLPRLLQSPTAWHQPEVYTVPDDAGPYYCLVLQYSYKLFQADPSRPMDYRDRLALAIGCQQEPIRIFPASPRVDDVAVDGQLCRTVLVVVPATVLCPDTDAFCVIVDCRAILQGWMCLKVDSPTVLTDTLLDELNDDAPLGWKAEVDGVSVGYVRLHLQPGQVLHARYVVDEVPSPSAADGVVAWESEIAIDDTTDHAGGEDAVPPALSLHSPTSGQAYTGDAHVTFLVARVGYTPELVSLALPIPCDVATALDRLSELVAQQGHWTDLQLQSVSPQPDFSFAVVLAVPRWPIGAPVVIIDGRSVDNRLFALDVAPVTQRRSLLVAAGYDPDSAVLVYLRDSPWPLREVDVVRAFTGDLIVVQPADHRVLVTTFLEDLLQAAGSWCSPSELNFQGQVSVMILTDTEPRRVPADSVDVAYPHADIADVLGHDLHSLCLIQVRPQIVDYCEQGHHIQHVFVATVDDDVRAGHGYIMCVLDLRPIHLGLQSALFLHGLADCQHMSSRLALHCPAGFRVCVTGGDCGVALPSGHREVCEGDVLTFSFVPEDTDPRWQNEGSHSQSPSHPDSVPVIGRAAGGLPALVRVALSEGEQRSVYHEGLVRRGTMPRGSRRQNICRGPLHTCLFAVCILSQVDFAATTFYSYDQTVIKWGDGSHEPAYSSRPRRSTPVPFLVADQQQTFPTCPPLFRHLPTPARADCPCPVVMEIPGPTLLGQAVQADHGYAYYLASTLLETLQEHLFPVAASVVLSGDSPVSRSDHLTDDNLASTCTRPLPQALMLEHSLPVSTFQAECLALQRLLTFSKEGSPDWLDNDLRPLLQDRWVPLSWRTAFVNIRKWHDWGELDPYALQVYTDGSAASHASDLLPCSWAFTVWLDTAAGRFLLGFASDTSAVPESPYYLGETEETALVGEQLALAWGLAWALEYASFYEVPVTFHYDAQSAGKGAFGEWRPPMRPHSGCPGYPSLSELLVYLRQAVTQVVPLHHAYVAGHSGQIENELADQLAKQSRRRPCDYWGRLAPTWPSQLARHSLLPWAWMVFERTSDLPTLFSLESEACRLQTLDARPQKAPSPGVVKYEHSSCVAEFGFLAFTYNVLTLRDPKTPTGPSTTSAGMRVVGRKSILKSQLSELSPLFVGLQETRVPDTGMQPDPDFLIFQSACTPQGSLGVALWVSKQVAYCTANGVPYFVQSRHCNIYGTSPRHLVLDIDAPYLKLVVIVLHAPTLATATEQEVSSFWRARTVEIEKRPQGADFLLLCDANARVGSIPTPLVGDHDKEDENLAGTMFRSFLEGIEGYLPSTFACHHKGESATWVSPFETYHRLDYIVTPSAWGDFQLASWVLPAFESLQKKDDHWPVVLRCAFSKDTPRHWTERVQRQAYRPAKPNGPVEQAQVAAALQSCLPVPWSADVDHHYDQLAEAWRQTGAALQPVPDLSPTQPYISESTLRLVRLRKELRVHLRAERAERRRRLLMFGFVAFRLHWVGHTFTVAQFQVLQRWFATLDHSEAEGMFRLMHLGFYLRKFIAADRNRYLSKLAEEVQCSDLRNPAALYASVRKAFPASRSGRRSLYQPLPAVKDAQGVLVTSATDRIEVWRQHFAAQEAGDLVTPSAYVADFAAYRKPSDDVVFSLQVVPTLAEVEGLILGMKRGKAPGPDSVTTEILQLQVPVTARQLAPVMLKTSLGLREPLTWRGGDLVCLAKRAGASLSCKDFRSILISSIPGKLYHRSIRTRLVQHLDAFRPSLQSGAIPGEGIELISIVAKTFQLLCEGLHRPWALVFVDLQAAYYQVIREALVPGCEDDSALLRLFHKLSLPPRAIDELKAHLQNLAILPSLQADRHLIASINDLFRGSWFRISGSALVTVTKRGTRPGDPAADALFSLTLAALMKSFAQTLKEKDLLCDLPKPRDRHEWACHSLDEDLGSPAWADDFFHPQTGPDATRLICRVQASTTVITQRATSMGMTVSFGREKTAVMLPARIPLLEDGVTQASPDGTTFIPIHDDLTGQTHSLQVVQSYKHLGGVIVATASPLPDLYHRFARANGVVKPLYRRLFSNPAVALTTRRALLRSLAISRFVHTSAAIVLHASCHKRVWAQQFVALWRTLLRRPSKTRNEHSYSVLRAAKAPAPPLAMAKARADFLCKLTQSGPGLLSRLLYDHWALCPKTSWLEQLTGDVQQIALYVPDVRALLPLGTEVQGLLDSFLEDPRWWSRQVRKAIAAFSTDLDKWHQLRIDGSPALSPAETEERPYSCCRCSATFKLRKHLCVHLSRTHSVLAPARHFAPQPFCISCHRYFGLVSRVQQHLKASDKCLRRTVQLMTPLSPAEIKEAEAPESASRKRQKAGAWKSFEVPTARPVVLGPPAPVWSERRPPVDTPEALLSLSELIPSFRPLASDVDWIEEYISQRSKEGPRPTASSFWDKRPVSLFA
ncbi:hypothetical protein AK812_SmicGene281 [Symbiodinium microadriaticum]|uniref:Uncharacterized protein n=1 Tax=Symbiodinium microadriaticum TaxID=2951 RepID=A0A1Q9F6W8_SYMMI|nr:hypothetical protein AK812_SmicGene281 [Symbiodinium microadriaticum]CAE7883540.1 unnamed protein product [Symbiodinium sp. KB8]CAE7890732.1 unnamed protein product [Symbiodinium microadriaticum]